MIKFFWILVQKTENVLKFYINIEYCQKQYDNREWYANPKV